ECALPHTAREPIPVRLAHEVEQLRALSSFVEVTRSGLHRCPARVRLGATPAAARTNTPAELHNRMPQFAGGPVAFPSPTSEHDRAAEAGSPPDSEKGREIAARAQLELRARSDCDVVCDPHASSHLPTEFLDKDD